MKIEVNVNVELGQATINALALVLGGTPAAAAPAVKKETKPAVAAKATAEDTTDSEATKPAAAPSPAPKAAAPAPKAAAPKPAEEDFDAMDEDAQLEAIKKQVTKHTKKGFSKDIKQLLNIFDADRATNLDTAVYRQFFDLINRYGAGESIDAIVEEYAV